MSSFHRPKMFKSLHGCCICRAKSSSSRFTDSGRYSDAFLHCFNLTEDRSGDICNACVLLIKRWRKLPDKYSRNWAHVVDARQGPGTKSYIRRKKEPAKQNAKKQNSDDSNSNEEETIRRSRRKRVVNRKFLSAQSQNGRKYDPFDTSSDETSDEASRRKKRRHILKPSKLRPRRLLNDLSDDSDYPGFIDPDFFTREEICCGVIFRGKYGEVILDKSRYSPCPAAKSAAKHYFQSRSQVTQQQAGQPSQLAGQPSGQSHQSNGQETSRPPRYLSRIEQVIEEELRQFLPLATRSDPTVSRKSITYAKSMSSAVSCTSTSSAFSTPSSSPKAAGVLRWQDDKNRTTITEGDRLLSSGLVAVGQGQRRDEAMAFEDDGDDFDEDDYDDDEDEDDDDDVDDGVCMDSGATTPSSEADEDDIQDRRFDRPADSSCPRPAAGSFNSIRERPGAIRYITSYQSTRNDQALNARQTSSIYNDLDTSKDIKLSSNCQEDQSKKVSGSGNPSVDQSQSSNSADEVYAEGKDPKPFKTPTKDITGKEGCSSATEPVASRLSIGCSESGGMGPELPKTLDKHADANQQVEVNRLSADSPPSLGRSSLMAPPDDGKGHSIAANTYPDPKLIMNSCAKQVMKQQESPIDLTLKSLE